jgi:2-methylisocitrate lyase-like PEP mutase family enzyme
VYGLDEALSRAKMAVAAGADVIFVEAPQSVDELKKVADTIDVPVMANMIEHGKTPLLSVDELQELGYSLVIYPLATLYMATQAMREAVKELKDTGTTAGLVDRMLAFHEFNDLVGLKDFQALERKYQVK